MLAASLLPVANSSAPMPTAAAPIGTTRRGPSRSIATPGDEAERRVAVVEQADQRRHAHAALRPNASDSCGIITAGAERSVLVEVVHRRDQPRDDRRLDAAVLIEVPRRCRRADGR